MKKIAQIVLLLAAGALSQAKPAQACGCYGGGPVEKSFKGADAVFSAEVTKIVEEKTADGKASINTTVTLKLMHQWKSAEGKTVTLSARRGMFEANTQYLVFAKRMPQSNILAARNCGGTALLAEAKEEVDALNEMVPAEKVPPVEPFSDEPVSN